MHEDVRNVVHVSNSKDAERACNIIYRDIDSISICNWYLRPSTEKDIDIQTFNEELARMETQCGYVLVVGDLNVHYASWLKHSNGDTPRDKMFHDICDAYGLKQWVKNPSRGMYLLDLVLSSCKTLDVKVCSSIADHNTVWIGMPDSLEQREFPPRHTRLYKKPT